MNYYKLNYMSKVESSRKNVAKLKSRQHVAHETGPADGQMFKWIMDHQMCKQIAKLQE